MQHFKGYKNRFQIPGTLYRDALFMFNTKCRNPLTAIFRVPLSQYFIYNLDTELLWKVRAAVRSHTRGADHRTS